MASFEDFTSTPTTTLDDFVTPQEQPKVDSKSSNLNFAATAVAIGGKPENAVDTFRQVNAELDQDGTSHTADSLMAEQKHKAMAANQRALVNLLADPSYTDEQKKQFAITALDEQNSQYSAHNALSIEALSAPVRNESPVAEAVRLDVSSRIQQINEIKRQQQALVNAELSKENPDFMDKAVDFAEVMLPFAGQSVGADVLAQMKGEDGAGYVSQVFSLAGQDKAAMREMLSRVPPEQQVEVTEKLVAMINASSGILFSDSNDFSRKEYLADVLDSYSTTEQWVDNVFSVVDMLGLGFMAEAPLRATKGTKITRTVSESRAAEVVRNAKARLVKSRVQPTTVGSNYKDTNADKAKATFELAVTDTSGEAAQALYGASREDVVSDTMLPELLNEDGSVMAKVGEIDKDMRLAEDAGDLELADFVEHTGTDWMFQEEKARATASVVNKFKRVIGFEARQEMFQVGAHADGVNIRGIYGPPDTGFSSAEEALGKAKMVFREWGVDEKDIKLLVRTGSDYKVVQPEEFDKYVTTDVIKGGPSGAMGYTLERVPKDYLVAVDYQYKFSPADIGQMAEADVKYNIFDRFIPSFKGKRGAGSLQRHMMDVASNLSPTITKSAATAVDRAAGLESRLTKTMKEFGDAFNKADPEMQRVMDQMIREANQQGKNFDYNEMVAAGLRDNEIGAMRKFREFWDDVWRISNRDAAKTLNNRGYKEFVDDSSDTKLFAKPVAENQRGKVGKVYDTRTGEVRKWSDQEAKALYESGGEFVKLYRPTHVGDEVVEYAYATNKADGTYLKGITENSNVLTYRKGYYAVHYVDPYFVRKNVRNKKGEILYTKAVATSKAKGDAELLARSIADEEGLDPADVFVSQDMKGSDTYEDHNWDIFTGSGMSNQRIRGKRLEEPDSMVDNPLKANVLDPVGAMIASARTVSRRAAMRDMIETHKLRFIQQYKEFLPHNEFGQPVFPGNVTDVKYYQRGAESSKKLADAHTTFTYLKYLEDGYINAIDDFWKGTLKQIADALGNKGYDKLDAALRWMAASRGPSAMGKNIAFNLYLALNPLRQFVVQAFQSVQLAAAHTRWVASGQAVPQTAVIIGYQWGIKPSDYLLKGAGWTRAEADAAWKAFSKTGQVAAIDKQNLVRGAVLDIADQVHLGGSRVGKAWRTVTTPVTWSRRVGFDMGEYVTTVTSWLAHRDEAVRAGADIADTGVQAEVAARARNFTYNMNAAGDMPYNQNALSLFFQFMQVPHKAALNMTFNRVMPKGQKIRLAMFNTLMFPLPPAMIYGWFGSLLPEDPEYRDAIASGLMGATFNKLLTDAFGEDTSIDWSSFSPTDQYGLYEFLHGLWTTDAGAMVAATPAGSMLFGGNPRLTNFTKTAARYFGLIDDFEHPTTFGTVANSFASLSSGYSNFMKGFYALEYEKKYLTIGKPDSTIPTPEAIAQIFGFGNMDEVRKRYVDKELWMKSDDFRRDVTNAYKEAKRHITTEYPNASQAEMAAMIAGEAWRVFGNDNIAARKIIDQQLRKDLADGDSSVYTKIIRSEEMFKDKEEVKNIVKAAPMKEEEQRDNLMNALKFMWGED